jgi:hypothetical protein
VLRRGERGQVEPKPRADRAPRASSSGRPGGGCTAGRCHCRVHYRPLCCGVGVDVTVTCTCDYGCSARVGGRVPRAAAVCRTLRLLLQRRARHAESSVATTCACLIKDHITLLHGYPRAPDGLCRKGCGNWNRRSRGEG